MGTFKRISAALVLVLGGPALSQAGYTPVVGSCKPTPLSPDLVECRLRGDLDGTIVTGTAFKWNVKCYHLAGYRSNPACQYPPLTGSCVFKNAYRFSCEEQVEADGVESKGVEEACQRVLSCLNNPLCIQMFCGPGAQDQRFGWSLDSFREN